MKTLSVACLIALALPFSGPALAKEPIPMSKIAQGNERVSCVTWCNRCNPVVRCYNDCSDRRNPTVSLNNCQRRR